MAAMNSAQLGHDMFDLMPTGGGKLTSLGSVVPGGAPHPHPRSRLLPVAAPGPRPPRRLAVSGRSPLQSSRSPLQTRRPQVWARVHGLAVGGAAAAPVQRLVRVRGLRAVSLVRSVAGGYQYPVRPTRCGTRGRPAYCPGSSP